jgi:predicted nucleic acid-binding protein
VKARVVVCLPEIVDYEIRRELKRAKKSDGLSRLDQLKTVVEYLPLSTEVMNTAAELWAYARNEGIPTAHDAALDIDMILIAQCRVRTKFEDDPVIATVDLGDIPRFIQAKKWQDISIP